jgi:two-component system, NtrC family, sensor kinase
MAKRKKSVRKSPMDRRAPMKRKRAPANVDVKKENTKLKRELTEAREQQATTGELLKVIGRSSFDLQAVFETLAGNAVRLCESERSFIFRFDDGHLRVAATHNASAEIISFVKRNPIAPGRSSASARAALEKRTVHVLDAQSDPDYTYGSRQVDPFRTVLAVPIVKLDELLGVILIYRREVRPFTDSQIALLETFADQAVIAIENARLFNEVQAKTANLEESLRQQTATADVLKVISRSTVDLETVLDTLVETVTRLCRADQAYLFRRQADGLHHLIAEYGTPDEGRAYMEAHPFAPDHGTTSGRVALERRAIHIPDVLADPDYTYTEGQQAAGYRTIAGVPLMRENTLVGVFVIARNHVDPFTTKEIELATIFADQAVIAIENARLFDELRERQAELRVTFDNMGDGVAMFGADKKLASWNRNLQEMLDLPDALLLGRPTFAEFFRYLAARGEFGSSDLEAELGRSVEDASREMRYERTRPGGRVVEVRRNPVPDGGFVLIYADITERKRAEEAIRLARDAAEKALRDLQTAQDRLIQTEKLASLGQLTAGIAHEIKNPLNFVNNFSGTSAELIGELQDVVGGLTIDPEARADIKELTDMLSANLEKIVQHGKRADAIVKSMLLHSGQSSGEHRLSDINALVDESLNRAYYGERAETRGFTIKLERSFDPDVGEVDLFPREISRAVLNLISNGFYATSKRREMEGDGYEPVLVAVTRNLGDRVEIRIRDNGSGIPADVKEKMFDPFFTTKPTGEGTGLGLSITHDIIVKQHGGSIEVDTRPGEFAEIRLILPRTGALLSERQ